MEKRQKSPAEDQLDIVAKILVRMLHNTQDS